MPRYPRGRLRPSGRLHGGSSPASSTTCCSLSRTDAPPSVWSSVDRRGRAPKNLDHHPYADLSPGGSPPVSDTEQRDLNRERTRELFEQLPSDPTARDRLVELQLPLVEYLARRFRGRGEPPEDLILG